jgi:glycosyltransferase involved in cell wall biosynthesis
MVLRCMVCLSEMKILHLAPHCDEDGNGVVTVAVDLACQHAAAGHSVGFASAGGSFIGLLKNTGVEHFAVEQDWTRPLASARGFFTLQRIIDRNQPDIVHAHAVPGALFACCLRNRSGFRLITSVHNLARPTAILMGVGDVVIAVSAAVAATMRQRGIPPGKLRVVRNGPLESPRRRAAFGLANEITVRRPAIVTVAGLLRNKGIQDLISAFAMLSPTAPEASLYIVGDGPERSMLEARAAALPCADKIHFTGFVRDPRPYLFAADIFVLASYREAFGLVLAEAREARCAVVASNVGGIPEALDNGRAGILLPPGQPRELADALAGLLADTHELDKWQTRAVENLEWLSAPRVAAETLGVYQDAVDLDDGQGLVCDVHLPKREIVTNQSF